MIVVRIAIMILRVTVLLALILGILFWTGNALSLVLVHMALGILAVLSLWTLGGAIASTKGGIGLAIGAFVWGLLLAALGLTQGTLLAGSTHWVIQVLHLLLGLGAIGLGEMIAGRYKRVNTAVIA
jgi:hypothetical protein